MFGRVFYHLIDDGQQQLPEGALDHPHVVGGARHDLLNAAEIPAVDINHLAADQRARVEQAKVFWQVVGLSQHIGADKSLGAGKVTHVTEAHEAARAVVALDAHDLMPARTLQGRRHEGHGHAFTHK